jgi:2-haloacid dehalogenase
MQNDTHTSSGYPKAVLFDLLTALLDSWTVWNHAAGSETAGRTWRAEYLRLTYGCGAYQPYEQLVRDAARNTGMRPDAADRLDAAWPTLPVWSGAHELLHSLAPHCKLAVVTNCSVALGRQAADRLGVVWDAVITSEEAGYYKPDPRPYQMALDQLDVQACDAAFVAGSGYDLFGTAQVGLRTYWHNRVGLQRPEGAPLAESESATLDAALPWLKTFNARPLLKPDPKG